MAPLKKSIVWKYYEKNTDYTVTCKICYKNIKTGGNTSNAMAHIKNMHKAIYWEIFPTKNTAANVKKDTFSYLNLTPSKPNDLPIPKPSTSTSPPMVIYDLNTNNSQFEETNDFDQELPFKRPKSTESFEEIYNVETSTADKTKRIDNAIIFMICKDNQPFSLIENEGFKHLLKVTAPFYQVPSKTILVRWLDEKYEELRKIMKNRLSSVKSLTLTSNIYSDSELKAYLGVTVHFGIGIEFQSLTLGVYCLNGDHNSEYIAEILAKICQNWGIRAEQVTAVITDNAASLKKAVEIAFGAKKHVPCFVHNLNLIGQKILANSDLQPIITKVRNIVTFFQESSIKADIILDIPSSWTSTHQMIVRFLDFRNTLNKLLIRQRAALPTLTDLELKILKLLLKILQPFDQAIKEISNDKYSSSKIIPLVHCVKSELETLNIEEEPLIKEIHNLSLAEVKRLSSIELESPLAVSTILDPRFKEIYFQNPNACAVAITEIKNMIKNSQQNESLTSESDSDDSEADSFWSLHRKLVQRNRATSTANERLLDELDELDAYLRAPVCRFNERPLDVWMDYKVQFPKLYKVAVKYLTIVAGFGPNERLYFKAVEQRKRLESEEDERVNKMLFLQGLDKIYWDL